MRSFAFALSLLFLVGCAEDPRLAGGTRPKARVLVMTGGGFNTGMFLGMLDGLRSQGWEPDYIVTACGASLASAIVNGYPRTEEQREYVESEAYRALLASLRPRYNAFQVATQVPALFAHSRTAYPDVFRTYFLTVPAFPWPIARNDQTFERRSPRLVMVAARALFAPSDVGRARSHEKLFEEVYFTDSETAAQLEGIPSPVGRPDTLVAPVAHAIGDATVVQGARASVTDPYYLEPYAFRGSHYFTGAIDLYPLETANRLGDEVVMVYGGPFSRVEQQVMANAFGYDNNRRLRQVQQMEVAHWIDTSDLDPLYARAGLNPQIDSLTPRSGIPAGLDAYRTRVRELWRFGRERGIEALRTPRSSRAHIRIPGERWEVRPVPATPRPR